MLICVSLLTDSISSASFRSLLFFPYFVYSTSAASYCAFYWPSFSFPAFLGFVCFCFRTSTSLLNFSSMLPSFFSRSWTGFFTPSVCFLNSLWSCCSFSKHDFWILCLAFQYFWIWLLTSYNLLEDPHDLVFHVSCVSQLWVGYLLAYLTNEQFCPEGSV